MARKTVAFEGTAREDLSGFPEAAKLDLGGMLWALQNGLEPGDYAPIAGVGPGAMELRATKIGPQGQDFRVVYVAKFEDHIYVLHAFEKKTLKTPQHQIDKAKSRYKALVARLKQAPKK